MSSELGLTQVMQKNRSLAGTALLNKSSEDKLIPELALIKKPIENTTKITEEEDELKDTLNKNKEK